MRGVTKTFGPVIANDKVDLDIRQGEILALLGENGSGKTTLMNMLAGIYYPDEGHIAVRGKAVTIRSPKDAFDLGIGMIHQHFKLVEVFTAMENIVLGMPGRMPSRRALRAEVQSLCAGYGLEIDPEKLVYEMSVSEKQTVEILKVLYRGAKILILDEPTAVLTPQETDRLFDVLRNMRADGKSIVIITHKLHEVMAISDRVAVLRKGQYVGDVPTSRTGPQKLTEMMMGRSVTLNIDRPLAEHRPLRLEVRDLTVRSDDGVLALDHVSFQAMGGEILGVAGISGSGQKELLEAIAGLRPAQEGSHIIYHPPTPDQAIAGRHAPVDRGGEELIGKPPRQIHRIGVSMAFVPEDRLGMGLVGSMGMVDNMMLKTYREGPGPLLDRKPPRALAQRVKDELEVLTPSLNTPVRRLSGGNVQKVLLGREISQDPSVLMTAYAVRGLDINTSYTIYNLLTEQKKKGVAVIFVGEDLDVLLELCDRILVLCAGKVNGVVDERTATKEEVGLMMTNLGKEAVGA